MVVGKSIVGLIDDFNKLILDLEDQAIIFLNSLPDSYEHFVDIIMFGTESLTMDEVQTTLVSKELTMKVDPRETNVESLLARGHTEKKNSQKKGKSRSKSQQKQ